MCFDMLWEQHGIRNQLSLVIDWYEVHRSTTLLLCISTLKFAHSQVSYPKIETNVLETYSFKTLCMFSIG